MEFQGGHQRDDVAALVVAELGGFQVQRGRRVAIDGGEHAIFKSGIPVVGEAVLDPFLGYLIEMFVYALQRFVSGEQRRCRFIANAGNAGDVVGLVADQGFVIRLLGGGEAAVTLGQLHLADDATVALAAGQIDAHLGGDQLEGVAVAGEDHRFDVGGFRLSGEGSNDVVGFPTGPARTRARRTLASVP